MEIKSFGEDLTTAEKLHFRTPFAEQVFAVHLLVEHLSIADSIKIRDNLLVDRN